MLGRPLAVFATFPSSFPTSEALGERYCIAFPTRSISCIAKERPAWSLLFFTSTEGRIYGGSVHGANESNRDERASPHRLSREHLAS
jgi:hypothetical protein